MWTCDFTYSLQPSNSEEFFSRGYGVGTGNGSRSPFHFFRSSLKKRIGDWNDRELKRKRKIKNIVDCISFRCCMGIISRIYYQINKRTKWKIYTIEFLHMLLTIQKPLPRMHTPPHVRSIQSAWAYIYAWCLASYPNTIAVLQNCPPHSRYRYFKSSKHQTNYITYLLANLMRHFQLFRMSIGWWLWTESTDHLEAWTWIWLISMKVWFKLGN